MEDTLFVGDFLLINKLVYGARIPFSGREAAGNPRAAVAGTSSSSRGLWTRAKNFVKRIVGIPGDTLEMRNAVPGPERRQPVHENYIQRTPEEADQSDEDFRWQKAYLVGGAFEVDQIIIHPVTTGVRWSSLLMTTSSSEIIATIRRIRGIGDSLRTLLCAASR